MKLWNIIWIGIVLVCGVGCSDFLDVQPKDKQSEEQLFSTRRRILHSGKRDI